MDDGIVVLVVNDEQDINKLGDALSNKDEKLFDEVSLSDDFLYVRGQSVKAAAGFGLVEIDRAKSIIDRGWAIITQKEFDDQYETG